MVCFKSMRSYTVNFFTLCCKSYRGIPRDLFFIVWFFELCLDLACKRNFQNQGIIAKIPIISTLLLKFAKKRSIHIYLLFIAVEYWFWFRLKRLDMSLLDRQCFF